MNNLPTWIRKKISIDLLLMLIFNVVVFVIFTRIEFFEILYTYLQRYESSELDEFILLFFTISISLVFFTVRRIFELKTLLAETEQLSIRDPLTGLYNRRSMQEMFNVEIERTKRRGMKFSVIIIDIDNFKAINDRYGHSVGDNFLIQFSKIILAVTRNIDITARWGGEEFLILCPQTTEDEARTVAKRLVSTIHDYRFRDVVNATASVGVVIANKDETFESIVSRADKCLYEAKEKGKNRFIFSSQ